MPLWVQVTVAGTLFVEILLLAWHADRLMARVRRLERLEGGAKPPWRCTAPDGSCPYVFGCAGRCEWPRKGWKDESYYATRGNR